MNQLQNTSIDPRLVLRRKRVFAHRGGYLETSSIELLETLSEALGVSGHEQPVRQMIRALVEPLCDEVFTDSLGNLFAVRRGSGDRTLMLDAHMDEVGLVISHVDAAGFLRFGLLGGYDERILAGMPVWVRTGEGVQRRGVVGTLPPHVLSAADREKPIRANELYIDVGARSVEEVEVLGIRVGDPAVPSCGFRVVSEDLVMGKAFDDRAGCALLIELLQGLQGRDVPVNLVFSFTVFEEVGTRGAGPAAYRVKPDLALAVECTTATDTPGVEPERQPAWQGGGPAITVADKSVVVNRSLVQAFETMAREEDIPYQIKKPLFGGTNAGAIHQSRAGVPTGVISVPCRYLHTPCQLLRLSDYTQTRSLLAALIRGPDALFDAIHPR